MADEYLDGEMQFGTRVLTINGATYPCDNFNYKRPSSSVVGTNETNKPQRKKHTAGIRAGAATLQLVDDAAIPPVLFDTFSEDDITWVITDVGITETKEGEKKVPITFEEVLNP